MWNIFAVNFAPFSFHSCRTFIGIHLLYTQGTQVEVVKSFPASIHFQTLASVQIRMSRSKFVQFPQSYPAQGFDFLIDTTPNYVIPYRKGPDVIYTIDFFDRSER